jgi:anti-sigma factor RsiW
MHCKKVRIQIDAYCAGEVSPEARSAIEKHLQSCDACRNEYAAVQRMASLFDKAVLTPPVPEGFAQRVQTLARRRSAQPVAAAWNLSQWWRAATVPLRAAAAAVLMIGVAVGVLMGWNTWHSHSDRSAQSAEQRDPLAQHNVDYLTSTPDGSLEQSYLTLVSSDNGEDK